MSDNSVGNETGITRRQLFLLGWAVTAVVIAGQGLAIIFRYLQPRVQEGTLGSTINAGSAENYAVGSVTSFREGRFDLVRLEGGFLALYRVCPHLGCIISWSDERDRFLCPCHAAVFSVEGEVLAGPPPRPMDLFPIEIVDGEIIVDTGTVVKRSTFEESQLAAV